MAYNSRSGKEFLDCPFEESANAKKEGARWDFNHKQWYAPPNLYGQIERFNRWAPNG